MGVVFQVKGLEAHKKEEFLPHTQYPIPNTQLTCRLSPAVAGTVLALVSDAVKPWLFSTIKNSKLLLALCAAIFAHRGAIAHFTLTLTRVMA